MDHVLPEGIPIRQWVLTLPHPLRYPLAFDGRHLSRVLRLFTDTAASWYRRHHPEGKTGAVTVIQRASSDLRLNPHFHRLFLDGVYLPGPGGEAPSFEAAPKPMQEDIEWVARRAKRRIQRYLEKRGVITFAAAPGDGEVEAVLDESLGESDPVLARLFSAATQGVAPAGPAQRRAPVRLAQGTATGPEPKGYLRAQDGSFNLHAARRVAPNDRQGREMLCRYILRPPLANERLRLSEDGDLTLEFKRPWKDGTRSIALEPNALLARLSAIVPPPRQHVILYFGVLSAHGQWRSQVVPRPKEEPETEAVPEGELPNPASVDAEPVRGAGSRNWYIPWHELLRRTFGSEVVCRDDHSDPPGGHALADRAAEGSVHGAGRHRSGGLGLERRRQGPRLAGLKGGFPRRAGVGYAMKGKAGMEEGVKQAWGRESEWRVPQNVRSREWG